LPVRHCDASWDVAHSRFTMGNLGPMLTYLDNADIEKQVDDGEGGGLRYGTCGMRGWRRKMEDAHMCILDLDHQSSVFGVFDGHGGAGVSAFAVETIPGILKESDAYKAGRFHEALTHSFLETDVRMRTEEGTQQVIEFDQKIASEPLLIPKGVFRHFTSGKKRGDDDDDEEDDSEEEEEEDADDNNAATAEATAEAAGPANGEPPAKKQKSDPEVENGVTPPGSEHANPTTPGGDAGSADSAEGGDGKKTPSGDDSDDEELQALVASNDGSSSDDEGDMVKVDPAVIRQQTGPQGQGATAVCALLVRNESARTLYVANAGDSRCVLCRGGEAQALSEDHKPENEGETKRIEAAGGKVVSMPQGGARVEGDLNLSRALGDLRYKTNDSIPQADQIISAAPEIREIQLVDEDEFMVLGCDGVWESWSNQEMVDFIRPRLKQGEKISAICSAVCDALVCPSLHESTDGSGCDNMTIMIVDLGSKPLAAT